MIFALVTTASAALFTFDSDCLGPATFDFGEAEFISDDGTTARYSVGPVAIGGVTVDTLEIFDDGDIEELSVIDSSTDDGFHMVGNTGEQITDRMPPTALDLGAWTGSTFALPGLCEITSIREEVTATATLDEQAAVMTDVAELAYEDRFGPTPRPVPSADFIEAELQIILDDLLDAGCIVDASGAEDFVVGAYGNGLATGVDSNGVLGTCTYNQQSKTFSGELTDGTTVGDTAFSAYNKRGQYYGERSDGGFIAGRWLRQRGTRGIMIGVTGTCDAPTDTRAALDDWYAGDL